MLSIACVLLFALAPTSPAQAKTKETKYYGELEPRLYTTPELMSKAVFIPVSIEDANQRGVDAKAADRIYSGELSLPDGGKVRNIYKAVVVRSPDGNDILYVDEDLNGSFDENERVPFLPVRDEHFSRLKDMASFAVELAPGGAFRTCPTLVALPRIDAQAPQITVEYTSTPYVRGFAVLPDRRLQIRFQYDFETGGISLKYGYEWLDLNGDGKFDMTPGSPEVVHGDGKSPVFQVGSLSLQVESVNLKRDQFVLHTVVTATPQQERRPSLPFSGAAK